VSVYVLCMCIPLSSYKVQKSVILNARHLISLRSATTPVIRLWCP